MRRSFIITSLLMHYRMLMRQKMVLLLLIGIPILFLLIVQLTSSEREILFQASIVENKTMIGAKEIELQSVFVSLAIIGFLASFVALSLVQQYKNVNRRLVTCGYYPAELMFSAITIMFFVILILALCVGVSILLFFQPIHFWPMVLGLLLTGIIYAGYGMLVGNFVKNDLEGILTVILLANIDAGWLQNPVFFAGARNKFIIQLLPAHHSSQISIVAAFSDLQFGRSIFFSVAYIFLFFGLSIIVSYYKMRVKKYVPSLLT